MNFSGNPLGARIHHTFLLSDVLLCDCCQLLLCFKLVMDHVTPAKKSVPEVIPTQLLVR